MKTFHLLAAAALIASVAAQAQTAAPATDAPMDHSAMDHGSMASAPTAAAGFNLDTPIETLAANDAARAVLTTDLPMLLGHPAYEQIKGLSLHQLQPYSQGVLTDELLARVGADLAAIH